MSHQRAWRLVDPFHKSTSGPHVQPCVERCALVWAGLLWFWSVEAASVPSLAVDFEWQALAPTVSPHRAWGGVRLVPLPKPSCFDACKSPRDVTWYKVLQKWLKRRRDEQTVNRRCVGLLSAFPSSSIMSTNKSLGDRSDVPDLLKSLADYPFSFPDFEDAGKSFFFSFLFFFKHLR